MPITAKQLAHRSSGPHSSQLLVLFRGQHGILNHLSFWPEQYRRTGGMSIVFLFDENPDVASAGSGGAAVRGGRTRQNEPQLAQPPLGWIMGGPLIASFDKGDVRMTPGGLTVSGDDEIYEIKLGVKGEDGRDGRINTFYDAIVRDRPLPAGAWGMATLEVLLAIEDRTRKEVFLKHQVP